MNYERTNAAISSPVRQDENVATETLLACVLRRLDDAASVIYNNTNEVEGKLNFILGQVAVPLKDSTASVAPSNESDFAQRVFSVLTFLERQAERLEGVRAQINKVY